MSITEALNAKGMSKAEFIKLALTVKTPSQATVDLIFPKHNRGKSVDRLSSISIIGEMPK